MIIKILAETVGASSLSAMVSRRMARLLGELVSPPQVEVVVCRLRMAFSSALRRGCSCVSLRMSRHGRRRSATLLLLPLVRRVFCPSRDVAAARVAHGRRYAVAPLLPPLDATMTLTHVVWHYVVARAVLSVAGEPPRAAQRKGCSSPNSEVFDVSSAAPQACSPSVRLCSRWSCFGLSAVSCASAASQG